MSEPAEHIHLDSLVELSSSQVSADLTSGVAGQLVILDLGAGIYYELNDVGAEVWKTLQEQPASVESILERLQNIYDVSAAECQADLFSLLEQLLERKLIEVRNG